MRPVQLTVNLDNQSATLVAGSQTPGAAGNLTLATTAAAIDSSGAARYLLLTTNADETSKNFVITGLDADGNTITETLAGANNTTAISAKAYASVSTIHVSAATTAAITFGTSNATRAAVSKTIAMNFYSRVAPAVAAHVTGTINYTVQETFSPILGNGTTNAVWQSAPSGITSKTADAEAQTDIAVSGVRLLINSYSNGATSLTTITTPQNSAS